MAASCAMVSYLSFKEENIDAAKSLSRAAFISRTAQSDLSSELGSAYWRNHRLCLRVYADYLRRPPSTLLSGDNPLGHVELQQNTSRICLTSQHTISVLTSLSLFSHVTTVLETTSNSKALPVTSGPAHRQHQSREFRRNSESHSGAIHRRALWRPPRPLSPPHGGHRPRHQTRCWP